MSLKRAFFLVSILVGCVVSEDFNPERCRFIDKTNRTNVSSTNNYLFRGNEPLYQNQSFSWAELTSTLHKRAHENNFTLPDDFYLVDINLLSINWDYEYIEIDFFKKYPERGTFINWPILGDLVDPNDLAEAIRKPLAETLDDWSLPDRIPHKMDLLHDMLVNYNAPGGRPAVIYFHCDAGEDRTGEMAGSYYMKWLDWSFHQALDYDNHIESRHIHFMSKNALQWYCYYLVYVEKRQLDCAYEG